MQSRTKCGPIKSTYDNLKVDYSIPTRSYLLSWGVVETQ